MSVNDRDAKRKRQTQDRNNPRSCKFFFNSCYKMLTEMMDMKVIIRAQHDQILNLCSAPGGFSKKLIEISPHCRVTAVTLPTTEPGALDNLFVHKNQTLLEANVVKLAQMPLHELYSTLGCCQVLEWRRGNAKTDGKPKFDLALLDGAFASDQETNNLCNEMQDEERKSYRKKLGVNLQLRMSEVAIACASLKQNGMLIARCGAKIHNLELAITWLLFKQLFHQVQIYYPSTNASSSMWSQSFIYFVCRGYSHPEEKVAHVFKKLQGYLAQVANSRFDFVKEIYRQDSIKELEAEMETVWKKQADNFKQEYENLKKKTDKNDNKTRHDETGASENMPISSTTPDDVTCSIPL